ncbi:hypothetical protein HU200_033908 [Digitaria exilis]|uniref:Reverse transcriptase zinc-binding domain-containing protein n=1 Tax=Digitaria exilis TaxID=1010633 RepID=A0A835BKV9_9POAL|nr:hypothetical protein HU200_033908 [Digitaria exilis]
MTVFSLSKWAIKRIDKIRRSFLWKGSQEAKGGHCLVNWRRVQLPKRLGGLGIHDLTAFNRALCLRWQWLQWKDPTRPWSALNILSTPTEVQLFRACTLISLGNGQRASFWHDRWLNGQSPSQIAPDLYSLAWRKHQCVATAMTNGIWKRGLRRMSTTDEINQYVELWGMLQQVQLNDQPDNIIWRFSANGTYSSSSAYQAQFTANFSDFDWDRLWKTRAENKCKFFGWLLLQNKLWTNDRIINTGGQANAQRPLCCSASETALHMLASCPYAQQVWSAFASTGIAPQQLPPNNYRRFKQWWTSMIGPAGNRSSQEREQTVVYIAWNIWKERCRRVFDHKSLTISQLILLIRQDIQNWQTAHTTWEE